MTTRVLLTGATGFIGSRVAAAARATPGVALRLATRRTAPDPPQDGTVYADLAAPASLRGSCEGVDAVIHCASRIGGDEQAARAVNDLGTRALVEEAVRAGATRIVYLSTASVLGRGPFAELLPGRAGPAPLSATSRTRAAAEQHVLEAGGVVVRPHLVYGRGDRWVIPGLAGLVRGLSGGLTGCEARHSMIDVESLGRALLGAALSPKDPAGVYHVNHPEPVTTTRLVAAVVGVLGLPPDAGAVDLDTARVRLADVPYARHHLDMLAVDHWFADDRVRQDLDWEPGDAFTTAFARHASWYREHLRG